MPSASNQMPSLRCPNQPPSASNQMPSLRCPNQPPSASNQMPSFGVQSNAFLRRPIKCLRFGVQINRLRRPIKCLPSASNQMPSFGVQSNAFFRRPIKCLPSASNQNAFLRRPIKCLRRPINRLRRPIKHLRCPNETASACNLGQHHCFSTDLFNALVWPLLEITVFGMVWSAFTRIARRVVAADERPPRIRTAIRVRTM